MQKIPNNLPLYIQLRTFEDAITGKGFYQFKWRLFPLDKWTIEDIFSDWRDIDNQRAKIIERAILEHNRQKTKSL